MNTQNITNLSQKVNQEAAMTFSLLKLALEESDELMRGQYLEKAAIAVANMRTAVVLYKTEVLEGPLTQIYE